jgi:beta-galactosidase/beta-glucuronidase
MVCLGPGNAEARYYWHDLKALIDGRGNHPSIYQFDTFNEQDMMHDFNTSNVVRWVKQYDNTRLVDTDSGGPANDLHVGDVDDLHVGGPSSNNPHKPGPRQYMMDGEYGTKPEQCNVFKASVVLSLLPCLLCKCPRGRSMGFHLRLL